MDRNIDNNFIKGYFGSAAAAKNEIYLDHQVLNYRVRLFCYFWYLHTHAVCFELCSVIYVSHCSNQWTCSLRNWYYCLYCVPNLCFYKHVRYGYKRGDSMICLLWMRKRLSWIFYVCLKVKNALRSVYQNSFSANILHYCIPQY